jgi:hypothetical protein
MIKRNKGQSLLELIIAIGIFVAVIGGLSFFIFDNYISGRLSYEITKANFLAEEGIEAIKSIRDNNFGDLTTGSYGLAISGGHWILQGTEEDLSSQITAGRRVNEIENIDQDRKKITTKVTWQFLEGRTEELKLVTYLTNWAKIIGDWAQPKFAGSYNAIGNADANDLYFADNKIYLVTANNTGHGGSDPEFYVLDVSNPNSPTLLGSLNLGATASAVIVSENYAYVASASNNQELQIVNISNPSSPSLVGSYNAPGSSDGADLFFSNNIIYLVTANNTSGSEFYILNVSNPNSPTLLGSLNLGAAANAVAVFGNYAYVASASNNQELEIINVSNPNSPSLAGSYNASGSSDALSVAVSGSTVYLGRVNNSGAELLILNVSNPASVTLLGSYEVGGDLNDVYFDSNRVFLATSNNSQEFQLVNVANPAAPSQISSFDIGGNANGVFYSPQNDLAYLASARNDRELVIIGPGP